MAKLFTNSEDPDQMLRSAASDLGLHCLLITHFPVSRLQWVKRKNNINCLLNTYRIWLNIFSASPLIQRMAIIQKDEKGYGFTVSGDKPVFVASVKPGLLPPLSYYIDTNHLPSTSEYPKYWDYLTSAKYWSTVTP